MTPTHSGIHFGRLVNPAFRHPLRAATLLGAVGLAVAMMLIAPVSGTACRSLADATHAPDVRVTALPGVDLKRALELPGLSASSGPYPGVGGSVQAGGREVSTWFEGRPRQGSAVDRPFLVSGTWTRHGGMVVEQGLARRLGLRIGRRVRVASTRGPLRLRVAGIAASSSVARTSAAPGLAYVLPGDLRRIAPAPVHGSTVLLQTGGRDSAALASLLTQRFPGPQAAIASSFGDRCMPQ